MNFLNSKEWRKFQEEVGRRTFDLDNGYLIKLDIPFGKNYLYSNYPEAYKHIDEIKKIGHTTGAVFFKWEPMRMERGTWNTEQAKTLGFIKSKKELQPKRTIVLDIKNTESELLKQMHQKARYNIRLAKKRGVGVEQSKNPEKDFEKFWRILRQTANRDKFYTHTKDYYKKLLESGIAKLYLAGRDNELHAAAIVVFYEGTATYLHGASSYKHRRDMATYLLHWKIILDAKTKNLEKYDFWGINEERWPGVTRFKRGFGGKETEYIGSWDMPMSKVWYLLYRAKNFQ